MTLSVLEDIFVYYYRGGNQNKAFDWMKKTQKRIDKAYVKNGRKPEDAKVIKMKWNPLGCI